MIIIYTPRVTNRIKYTFDFVFRNYFDIPYKIVEESNYTLQHGELSINYSAERREGSFNIFQDSLLLETTIVPQHIFVSREMSMKENGDDEGLPVFFQTADYFDLKFDIFSCIFYLLSRYEEYLPHERDLHGRFSSSSSILSKPAFQFSPIVELWLNDLKNKLSALNPSFAFKEYRFEYLPTIDIDNAYKYKGRRWWKRPANILSKECIDTLRNEIQDPYDTTDTMIGELRKTGQKPMLFFLMSDESEHDSKVSPESSLLYQLIRRNAGLEIGVHPSYDSANGFKIETEKKQLEHIIQPVIYSRQHFLRISFPSYYRLLIKAGIQKDFSLAYPDVIGYRAGYSREFLFYDLEKDEVTPLILQPSCWMDATYEYYQSKNFQEICEDFIIFLEQLKKINAKLVTIFHNDLFATDKFRSVFIFVHHHVNSGV